MGREGRKRRGKYKGRRNKRQPCCYKQLCMWTFLTVSGQYLLCYCCATNAVASLEWLASCEYSRCTNTGACVTFSGSSVAAGFFGLGGMSGFFFSPEGRGQDQAHVYSESLVDTQQQGMPIPTHSGPVLRLHMPCTQQGTHHYV